MTPLNRKTYSASRSRKTSQHLRTATYGTHHSPRVSGSVSAPKRHSGNASGVGFSSSRRNRRATRGYVDQLTPTSSTRESSGAYSKRMNRREFSVEVQHQTNIRRIAVVIVVVLLVVVAAGIAANLAYFGSVNSKLKLSDENVASVLTAQTSGEPYYVLLAADLTSNDGDDGLDALALARVDETNKQATLIIIPANARLLYNGNYTTAQLLDQTSGDSVLTSTIASTYGVSISHFMRTTQAGFEHFVDALEGGITLTIKEEVDDPSAGSVYLAAGEQTLDGASASYFMKASNYTDGEATQLDCQCQFAIAFGQRFFAQDGYQLGLNLDAEAKYLQTDWSGRDVLSVLSTLRGMETIYAATADGYEDTVNVDGTPTSCYVMSTSGITALVEAADAGEDPALLNQTQEVSVDKESFEIIVLNGCGITGGASAISDILTNAGFQVKEVGNADSAVYTETLVIYLDSAYADAAEAVQQALGAGRVIDGSNFYSFDAQVEVVLGSDWKPLS